MKRTRKVRTVSRSKSSVAGSKKTRRKTSTSKKAAGFDRGRSGFRKAADKKRMQDEEYERKKNTPYDFRLKPGDEAEVVVLDTEEPFFVSVHKFKHNGRWTDEVCIADTGQRCPLCDHTGKDGSYTMYLTVLDRRPYKIQKGPNAGKVIKASRKLLPVKGRNLPKFERQYRKYEERAGKWRGLRITCRRDGEKEAAIGEDLEFGGIVKESILIKYKENAQPANYEEIFEMPTAEEIVKRYGLDSKDVVGQEEFGGGDDDDDLDDVKW
jgi:hypothetical protein